MRVFARASLAGALAGATALVLAGVAGAFDAKRADESTVRIIAVGVTPQGLRPSHSGTGFVVDGEFVVTNAHVADERPIKNAGIAEAAFVVPEGSLQKLLRARVVWRSEKLDLAVLRVEGLRRPAATLHAGAALEYPPKAASVFAVGFPVLSDNLVTEKTQLSLNSTVTQGVVGRTVIGSAEISGFGAEVRPIIQHSAAISGGNSGGPLFDACGVVVGVNTFGPRIVVKIVEVEGKTVGAGDSPSGIFGSPHVANVLGAIKAAPELKDLRPKTTTEPCVEAAAETPTGVYVGIGVLALLVAGAIGFAATRRGQREVVRVVESYSAYIRKRGKKIGDPRTTGAGAATNAVTAALRGTTGRPALASGGPGWTLTGRTAAGADIAIAVGAADLAAAAAGKDKGVVLGRSAGLCDRVVDDQSVSRRHARLAPAGDGLTIEDLKSAFGTSVNGRKLAPFQPEPLAAGDTVVLGALTLTVAATAATT
jgi:hypothetical protein